MGQTERQTNGPSARRTDGSIAMRPIGRSIIIMVSGVRRMNKVNPRRALLVHGWVTVFGRVYHVGM